VAKASTPRRRAPKILLTPEKREEFTKIAVAEYRKIKSTQQIAEDLGLTRALVYQLLVGANEPLRRKQPTHSLSAEERKKQGKVLRAKYEAGGTYASLAAEYGIPKRSVEILLAAAGTSIRPSAIGGFGSDERATLAQDVRDDYEKGLSLAMLAIMYGHTDQTVRRLITEAGGTIRTQVVAGLPESARPRFAAYLRKEYEGGRSLRSLSKEIGAKRTSVRCLVLEAGATLRPPSGPALPSDED
jgi:DNA-binding transcriptional regulator LsrR (DeoR family)